MVSNPSQRILNLGRYSIVQNAAISDLQVGSFWKRKQIDADNLYINTTTEQNPKRFAGEPNHTTFQCHTSSGRGSEDHLTIHDSLASIHDHELNLTNNDLASSDKHSSTSEEDICVDQSFDTLTVENSQTTSPILYVDTSTPDTSIGGTHESLIVDLNPNGYLNECNQESQISQSNLATTPSVAYGALRRRKKTYPIQLAYEKIMSGVNFVMSGFENPRRARLRDKAIAMGACYNKRWQEQSTHLICAFKNTLKHKEVMAAKGRVVREHWIQECSREKQLLDWRNYKLGKYSYPDSEEEVPADDNSNNNEDSEQLSP